MLETTFLAGTAALLVAPGPTNAVLFAAGAARCGLRSNVLLIAAAIGGYLVSVSSLLVLAVPLLDVAPTLSLVLRGAICLYLLHLAVSLWRKSTAAAPIDVVSPRQVAVTTLLNPKALVVALALIPPSAAKAPADAMLHLAALAGLIAVSSALWLSSASLLARAAPVLQRPAVCCRLCALALVAFAGVLGSTLVASVG